MRSLRCSIPKKDSSADVLYVLHELKGFLCSL